MKYPKAKSATDAVYINGISRIPLITTTVMVFDDVGFRNRVTLYSTPLVRGLSLWALVSLVLGDGLGCCHYMPHIYIHILFVPEFGLVGVTYTSPILRARTAIVSSPSVLETGTTGECHRRFILCP